MTETVLSLTSVPPRFRYLPDTLHSLLAQTAPVAEIRLHIPWRYRRFPDWDGTLPAVPKGVRLVRTEVDFGPASKVLHAAEALRGTGARILFCDDDRIYPADWARVLLSEHDRRPDHCVALLGRPLSGVLLTGYRGAHRPRAVLRKRLWDMEYRMARLRQQWAARKLRALPDKPPRPVVTRAGYADVFWGYGGVVVTPDVFDDVAFDIPAEARGVDDIWLSGMLARRDVPIWLPGGHFRPPKSGADPVAALRDLPDFGGRDSANRICVQCLRDRFGIWPES